MQIGGPTNFKHVQHLGANDLDGRRKTAPAIVFGTEACSVCGVRSASLESCAKCSSKSCATCMGPSGVCDECSFFQKLMQPKKEKQPALVSSLMSFFKSTDQKVRPGMATPAKPAAGGGAATPGSALRGLLRRGSSALLMRQPSFGEGGNASSSEGDTNATEGKVHEEIERLRALNKELEDANEELRNALLSNMDMPAPPPLATSSSSTGSVTTTNAAAAAAPAAAPASASEDELKQAKEHVVSLQVQVAQAKSEILALAEQLVRMREEAEANNSGGAASSAAEGAPTTQTTTRSTVPPAPPLPDTPAAESALVAISQGTYTFWEGTFSAPLARHQASSTNSNNSTSVTTTADGKTRTPVPQAPPLPGFSAPPGGGLEGSVQAANAQQPRRGSAPANMGGPLMMKRQASFLSASKKGSSEDLRPVYWTPIEAPKVQGTIWEKLGDKPPVPLNNQQLEKHLTELSKRFAKKPSVASSSSSSSGSSGSSVSSSAPPPAAAPRPKILEPGRMQNIGIGLSGAFRNVTIPQIRKHIIDLDKTFLTVEVIHKLLALIPTGEETKLIEDLRADKALDATFFAAISKEENFTIEMAGVPRLRQRLQCMFTEACFQKTAEALEESIGEYLKAIAVVKNSQNWRGFLHLCLETGNFMNEGSKRAGAWGFSLDSIVKLSEAKAGDSNKYSILHWIADVAAATKPELLKIEEEFEVVETAAGLSVEEIKAEFAQLKRQIDIVKREVEEAKGVNLKTAEGAEIFVKRMDGPFLVKIATPALDRLATQLATLEKEAEEVIVMHGERSNSTTCQKLMGSIITGAALFIQCHRENEVNRVAAAKALRENHNNNNNVAGGIQGTAKQLEKAQAKDKVSKILKDTGLATGKGRDELEAAMAKRREGGGKKV